MKIRSMLKLGWRARGGSNRKTSTKSLRCRTTPFTQMGRVVRFEFFTSFYVYLPFTKARLPCPLVIAGLDLGMKNERENTTDFQSITRSH